MDVVVVPSQTVKWVESVEPAGLMASAPPARKSTFQRVTPASRITEYFYMFLRVIRYSYLLLQVALEIAGRWGWGWEERGGEGRKHSTRIKEGNQWKRMETDGNGKLINNVAGWLGGGIGVEGGGRGNGPHRINDSEIEEIERRRRTKGRTCNLAAVSSLPVPD